MIYYNEEKSDSIKLNEFKYKQQNNIYKKKHKTKMEKNNEIQA